MLNKLVGTKRRKLASSKNDSTTGGADGGDQ
jgi:hypothetical protein